MLHWSTVITLMNLLVNMLSVHVACVMRQKTKAAPFLRSKQKTCSDSLCCTLGQKKLKHICTFTDKLQKKKSILTFNVTVTGGQQWDLPEA